MNFLRQFEGSMGSFYSYVIEKIPVLGSRKNPLIAKPKANGEIYRKLAKEAAEQNYPEVDAFETITGHAIATEWLHELALHTQVVVKKSPLCYAHGRVLYSALSRYLESIAETETVKIVETGTARGFSCLCMARALSDMGRHGSIVTFDTLPHQVPIYWNCIDDINGKRSRETLLAPWSDLAQQYLVFLEGDTRMMLQRVNLGRVHFAFLDGAHTYTDVSFEFRQVAVDQRPGDIVVFDDYTPSQYPGLVQAVDEICNLYHYVPKRLFAHSGRGYVVAIKQ